MTDSLSFDGTTVQPSWLQPSVPAKCVDRLGLERIVHARKSKVDRGAVNVGAGFRIVPTFLSNTLLRIDFAQLFAPSPNSLIQIGITQYF